MPVDLELRLFIKTVSIKMNISPSYLTILIILELYGMVSYEMNYFPIKFQDKILRNVEVFKKNANRLAFLDTL